MRRVVCRAGAGLLAMAMLAGCAGGGQEPPGLTASPSVAAESPTPTPTPTAQGPMDRSDPELGIVFTDLPEVTGDVRSALDTLTLFEVESRRATTSGVFEPSIGIIAGPAIVALVEGQVNGNLESGWSVGGVLRVTVDITEAGPNVALGTVCQDFTDVLYTNAGVTYSAEEVERTEPYLFRASLSRASGDGGWMVDSYERDGTC